MTDKPCTCSGEQKRDICLECGGVTAPGYWCETCKKAVPDKRCPLWGLKAKKI